MFLPSIYTWLLCRLSNLQIDFPDSDLLEFKSTGEQQYDGHVLHDVRGPDLLAAFSSHWTDAKTLWPCMRLVGEIESKGKSCEEQVEQVISYLCLLLLARPDFHVAQGIRISETGVDFIFAIGGYGIRTFPAEWGDKAFSKWMFAFVYRLYDPGDFADSSYVDMVPNLEEKFVTYTVRLNGIEGENSTAINDLRPIYATNPFGTRTHVLSNPTSNVMANGKLLTVLKEQMCRVETRFNEYDILTNRVHGPGNVPGVVEAVCHEEITIPRGFCSHRTKHRMGLRQAGTPITSITTLAQVLEVIFDILEGNLCYVIYILCAHSFAVLRYLRFERHVLHRDISIGNVLYNPPSPTRAPPGGAKNKMRQPEDQSLCFIRYLLGERCVEILHNWGYTNMMRKQ